ncbi:hypothetical protein C900_01400 [Fulvivirga imtechensis AK7]|uniref:Uncharacterized protein n=1 Tax=Fulvivirga imtechensis AK7 TaxID=1237149 RepID=L8JYE7_9BACT|nr:hypothetical protein C900_01400 [Fulvivirga imtechensis AK7]
MSTWHHPGRNAVKIRDLPTIDSVGNFSFRPIGRFQDDVVV